MIEKLLVAGVSIYLVIWAVAMWFAIDAYCSAIDKYSRFYDFFRRDS